MTIALESFSSPNEAIEVACSHCGQPVASGLIDARSEHQFCCAGCSAVFSTLQSCGLEAYYRLRDLSEVDARPARPSESAFASFDSATFAGLYVQKQPDGICSADLALEGVTCAACVWLVERLPRVLDGVIESRLSLREATVRVTWDSRKLPLSRVAQTLNRLGYTPHPARGELGKQIHRKEARRRLIHLGAAGAIMGNTMLLALGLYAGSFGQMEEEFRTLFRWLSAGLGLISLSWPGSTFFRSAWAAIRNRTTNLDVPIALALAVGGIAGLVNVVLNRGEIYFDSLTVLVFLLLVGRFIQYRQQRWADDAVGLLFNLTPSSCRRVEGDRVEEVPVEAISAGDLIEVRAGELFPADGVVRSGRSSANQALLTGESAAVDVECGSAVHAGAQNIGSVLRVEVEKLGNETRVGKLMKLIEQGVREKPAIVQFADRVGSWFIIVVTLAAAGVFAFWSTRGLPLAIDHTVALLIVTCPCVLGLATPLTIAIAIGKLARADVLVKSGVVLERLARGGSLLLDKTGTLTEGRMQLLGWQGDERWKSVVAALERDSNHPVGRALREGLAGEALTNEVQEIVERGDGGIQGRYEGSTILVGSPTYLERRGIDVAQASRPCEICVNDSDAAVGATVAATTGGTPVPQPALSSNPATLVGVAVNGLIVATAAMGDRLRADSKPAIARLRELGFEPAILSGDASDVVSDVARSVGIDAPHAAGRLSPEQKLDRINHRSTGRATVMVGDGVNDAAALAAADVGIAVHGGAEASLAAADVYIARPGLRPLVDLVEMSRRTMRVVRRNLVVSLSYNLLAGVLAAAGVMTPMLAAIIMPISSASVLALSIISIGGLGRLKPVRLEGAKS